MKANQFNKRVLVTGSYGYIASHVILELLEKGYEVYGVDNNSGQMKVVLDGVTYYDLDIRDTKGINRLFSQIHPHAVMHFAGLKAVGESMTDPGKYMANNISGTITLLNAMSNSGCCNNFIFSSSAAVYGIPLATPISELDQLDPINVYGYTKLMVEKLLPWYKRTKGLNYINLRYFNAVGYDPKGRITGIDKSPNNLMPIIMDYLRGKRSKLTVFGSDYPTRDGTCERDYVHVTDLAKAHVLALEKLMNPKDTEVSTEFNLGTNKGLTVKELLQEVATVVAEDYKGKWDVKYSVEENRPGDPAKLVADSRRAQEELEWESTELSQPKQFIKTTIDAYIRAGKLNYKV